MGDNTPSTNELAGGIFSALQKYAPGAIQAISGTIPGTAQAQLSAAQGVEPGYEQLYNQNQLASAATEAAVAGGPGAQMVNLANQYQQQLDPQYYAQRGNINDAINKYLSSYSPTELTPTEVSGIARGINAITGAVSPSNLNTIKNAQVFGAAGTERWKNFGDAITRAASVLPQLKSGINGFQVATQRGTNNAATNATNNALNANYGFSSSALGDISGQSTAQLQKRKSPLEQIGQATSAIGNLVGAAKTASAIGM